jgi:hypothetical protein
MSKRSLPVRAAAISTAALSSPPRSDGRWIRAGRPGAAVDVCVRVGCAGEERLEQVHRQGEDDRGVLVGADFQQGLQ